MAQPEEAAKKPDRAKLPNRGNEDDDLFFKNVRDAFQGDRPKYGQGGSQNGMLPPQDGAAPSSEGSTATGGMKWTHWISRTTIEDEVKRYQSLIAESLKTPSGFKGGGYKDCRTYFSVIAMLYAIAAEYDGDVRWKEDAPMLRDLFGRASKNCKVGTDGSYNEAKLRLQDLEELIRGGKVSGKPSENKPAISDVFDRPPIMSKMEEVFQKKLNPALSNAVEFKKNQEQVLHEAELLAAMGEMIVKENFEYSDDGTFKKYASALRDASKEIAESVPLGDYDRARTAAGKIANACSECHDGYRN